MPYPALAAPYGLIPINLIGGHVFAGSTRMFSMASGYNTGIFFGDPVKLNAGMLEKDAGTVAATPVGIFMGCSYSDPVFGKTFRQNFPANTIAADIRAYVCDDPSILFKIAVVSGTNVITTTGVTRAAAIGKNAALVQNAGNLATGNSAVALLQGSLATANTLPLRVVDVVQETAISPGNYTELICKWNAGMHAYGNPLGV